MGNALAHTRLATRIAEGVVFTAAAARSTRTHCLTTSVSCTSSPRTKSVVHSAKARSASPSWDNNPPPWPAR